MTSLSQPQVAGWRSAGRAAMLVAAASGLCAALDGRISLTSQAMVYLVAVVVAAYVCERVAAVGAALASVTALNFLFVPPRYTLAVENREHLIALVAMLGVALLVNGLSSRVREQSRLAARSEARARQLSALATELVDAPDEASALTAGERALGSAFERAVLVVRGPDGELGRTEGLASPVLQSLRCAIDEAAAIGPGTGRWPGLDAWVLPLGSRGHVVGAVRVEPAVAADEAGREHALALASVLAQALWRLRAAEAQRQAREALQRQEVQSTFLAAVSHDLRTPLAAIVAAASSLQAQRVHLDDAEQQRMLAGIVGQARHLTAIADNTLELVRLSAGPLALRPEWQSLEEIVGSTVARRRGQACAGRIVTKVEPALPLVRGDATLLAQLLANLLDNACAYGQDPVEVQARRGAAAEEGVRLEVADRGTGLPPDVEAHAFEAFFRGERRRPGQGAGLGLALCKAIAEAHGGTLRHERRRSGGSRFVLTLPAATQPVGAPAEPSLADSSTGAVT